MDPISFQPIPVETQLNRLREFNTLNKLGITDEEFEHLAKTAPPWPTQPGRIRSLRVHTEVAEDDDYGAESLGWDRYVQNMTMCDNTGVVELRPRYDRQRWDYEHSGWQATNWSKRRLEWIYIQLIPDANEPTYLRRAYATCEDELLTAAWIAQESFKEVLAINGGVLWGTKYEFGQPISWGPVWNPISLWPKTHTKGSTPLALHAAIVYESDSDHVRVRLDMLTRTQTAKGFDDWESIFKRSEGDDHELITNVDMAHFSRLYAQYKKGHRDGFLFKDCAVWIAEQLRAANGTTSKNDSTEGT